MKFSSRSVTAIATAIFLGSLASAASASTLTVWTFLNPTGKDGREVAFQKLITEYEAKHPDTKIRVEPQIWNQLTQKFVLGSNLGKAPDIVFTHGNNLQLLAESGAAADLDKALVDKWSPEETKDFLYPGLLKKARINGKLLGVPVFPFATVLYYRKDLLKAAGYSKDALSTWDSLVPALKAVQTDTISGMTIPLSQEKTTQTPLLTYMLDAQGKIFGDNCKPEFATKAGVEGLELQASFFAKGGIASKEDISRTLDDSWDLFLSGRAAVIMNASTRAGQVAHSASWDAKDLGIAALPGIHKGKPGPSVANAWYLTVWDKSPSKAEAVDFVNFLVSNEGSRAWTLIGKQPALRKSVLDAPEMATPRYELLKEIGAAMSASTADLPTKCRADRVYSDLNEATQAVLVNGKSPIDALKAAEARAEARN